MADYLTGDCDPVSGAVVTFTGVVRDHNDGRRVTGMFYQCYREMAEREIAAVVESVKKKYRVKTVEAVHRVGELAVGDVSLLVVVASAHRRDAFEAIQEFVDVLKERVPIWKKERYADGTEKWL